MISFGQPQYPELSVANLHRIGKQSLKYLLQLSGRRTDDAQNFGSGRLLRQRLGELVGAGLLCLEQTCVLDGDDGLVGEGFDQLDLLLGERPDLAVPHSDSTDDFALA